MSEKSGLAIGGAVVATIMIFGPLLAYPFWWPIIPLGLLFALVTGLLIDSLIEGVDK